MVKITVLMDDAQQRQIGILRAADGDISNEAFWSIVLGDGISLYRFQQLLEETDGDSPEANRRLNEEFPRLPDIPGPAQAFEIPVDAHEASELAALRRRRPDWDEALFWQQALDWGTDLLAQRLDEEDQQAGPVETAPYDPDENDGIPF